VGIDAFRQTLPVPPLQSLGPAGPVDDRHPIEIRPEYESLRQNHIGMYASSLRQGTLEGLLGAILSDALKILLKRYWLLTKFRDESPPN